MKGFRYIYKRKTIDQYQIFMNTGNGYSQITHENTRKEAEETVKILRQKHDNTLIKIIKKRIKID